jgi:poly-gamma-glutamate synthesis protein (capsule biosynthesis protein)
MSGSKEKITIIAVGDIFLGEHPVTLNHGVNSIVKVKGCDFLFSAVSEYLAGGDIVCGNLEGIISPKKNDEKGIEYEIFWGQPECASALQSAGFNCLFIANNHFAQHGPDAIKRTCRLLDDNHIKWTGYHSETPTMPAPVIFSICNLRVALLAYCESQQYHLDTPMLPIINYDVIRKQIELLKSDCDIIILSLHWGDEFIEYPSPQQIDLARSLIDLGVHLILGHHSHTVQGIERYKHGLIAYSLGSFVKDLWPVKLRESIILRCTLTRTGVECYELTPIFIKKDYKPVFYAGEEGERFLNHIKKLSARLDAYNPLQDASRMHKDYLKDVKKLLISDRIGTLVHYITHLFKYDPSLLINNIRMMVMRRLYGRNL